MIHITDPAKPNGLSLRTEEAIHSKVDKLVHEPITQNRLLQTFNYYERAEAGRYLRDRVEAGAIRSYQQPARRGAPATVYVKA